MLDNEESSLVSHEDELLKKPGKHRKQQKKRRSRSLMEVVSLAGIQLPAISRPKFVDNIISGASSLTKKSSLKKKVYKRQLSSLEQPTFYGRCSASSSAECLLKDNDGFKENRHTEDKADFVLFCSQCGLQILCQDVNDCFRESDDSTVSCAACRDENSDLLCDEKQAFLNSDRSEQSDYRIKNLEDRTKSVDITSDCVDFRLRSVDSSSEPSGHRSKNIEDRSKSVDCVNYGTRSTDTCLKSSDYRSRGIEDRPKSVDCGSDCVDYRTRSTYTWLESSDNRSNSVEDIFKIANCSLDCVDYTKKNKEDRSTSVDCNSNCLDINLSVDYCSESLGYRFNNIDDNSNILDSSSDCIDDNAKNISGRSSSVDLSSDCVCCRTEVKDCSSKNYENALSIPLVESKGGMREDQNLLTPVCQQSLYNSKGLEDLDHFNVSESDCRAKSEIRFRVESEPNCISESELNSRIESEPNSRTQSESSFRAELEPSFRADLFGSIIPGSVRRKCQALTRSSQVSQATPYFDKKVEHFRSTRLALLNSLVRNLHKGSLSSQAETINRWPKSYCSFAWDNKFPQEVMAKGYVKALAEQINHQGSLTNVYDHNADESGHKSSEFSRSVSSHTSCDDSGEMCRNIIHTLIQSADLQQSHENGSIIQTKKSDLTSSSLAYNNLNSERFVPLSIPCCVSEAFATSNGDCPHFVTTENSISCQQNEIIPVIEPHNSHCLSTLTQSQCNSLVTSSPISSRRSLRKESIHMSQSPSNSLPPSPSRQKPMVDYTSKPRMSKIFSHRSVTELNNCETSAGLFFSTPCLSPAASPLPPSVAQLPIESLLTPPYTSPHQFKYANPSYMASDDQLGNVYQPSTSVNSPSCTIGDQVSLRSASKRNRGRHRDTDFNTIYDNAPPLNAAELFDSSWSDSDSLNDISDEDDEVEDEQKNSKDSNHQAEEHIEVKVIDQPEVNPEVKRFQIACELLQTERAYVERLHLLHHVFFFRLDSDNRLQAFLPADTLQHMFSNTKSIYDFHQDFLLPQLEGRMKNWDHDPRIGDLMKQNAPFLKLYTEYIRNFDRAMKLINHWMEKSARFSEIILDVQKLPECGSLSLQHHMLGPIQRVPRYELLLKDYVKNLPEGSTEMIDAKDALDLVTEAACHSNEAMKKIETFHKLLDIYQSLRGVPVDFISPTREFVTQGPVIKIAARSGERQPRHIFLFNDLVLVCSQYNLLGTCSVRSQLEVNGMEIKPGKNTFLIHSKQKVVELLDERAAGESTGWQEKIQTVITKYKERKKNIKQEEQQESSCDTHVPESCLGKTAPIWIHDEAASMCMLCRLTFNVMRRKHHCRACGKLICKACSKKAPLEYLKGKVQRVCAICYKVIVKKQNVTAVNSSVRDKRPKKMGILHVKASEPGLISGYMRCSEDGGHSWHSFWVTAHKDFVLYSFRTHEDVSAVSSLPLPGYEVDQVWDLEGRPHVFSLSHKKKRVCMFQTDSDKCLKRWVVVLEKLVRAELPDDSSRLSSQSSSSNSSSVSDASSNNNDCNHVSDTNFNGQTELDYPCRSSNSLSATAEDDNADRISQYDNVDGVVDE